ncbi:MAG: hypothetical protein ACQERZ_09875 [Fusobacteriota bacterium]
MMIIINRDSVCMGDDFESHELSLEIDENINYEELFQRIIDMKYLPSVDGDDVVWVLTNNNEELLSYVTKTKDIYSCFINSIPNVGNRLKKNNIIHLKYFSSRIKRAERLFKKHDGKKFHIWHEGYMKEYESYNIKTELEEVWLQYIFKKR